MNHGQIGLIDKQLIRVRIKGKGNNTDATNSEIILPLAHGAAASGWQNLQVRALCTWLTICSHADVSVLAASVPQFVIDTCVNGRGQRKSKCGRG